MPSEVGFREGNRNYKSINVPEGTARLQSLASDPKQTEEVRKAARGALVKP